MAKGEAEQRIDESWDRLFKSYKVLKGGLKEESLAEEELFEISKVIPRLTQLIDGQDNCQELELELKQLVMKSYWDGYYNGIENEKNKS